MVKTPRLDVAVIERMPEQPDIIADYDQLIAAFRARVDTLQLSQALIDDLAGWASGYSGKLFGPSQTKRLGLGNLFILLETLGLGLALVENPAALRKMERRYERRSEWTRRTGVIRKQFSPEVRQKLVSEHMSEIGSIGGRARAKCVAARSARHAALSRWARVRNGG